MAAKTTRADFEQVFPSLVEDLLGEAKKFNLPDNALQWLQRASQSVRPECAQLTLFLVPQCQYTWWKAQQRHVSSRHRPPTS